jgi:hypothetical protein
MRHPLEFVPNEHRKQLFFTLLSLTLVLFAVFRVLDQPLRTPAAPNGIVSFELARTSARAQTIVDVWTSRTVIYTDGENQNAVTAQPGEPFTYNPIPIIHVSFGLGIDYLFIPLYAFALAFGSLLAAGRHSGWFKSIGAAAGYGAFAAASFDAVENYALLQILLNKIQSPYPEIAFYCASIKFGLLIFGLLYMLAGWLLPKG